jgi:hypothetical protein
MVEEIVIEPMAAPLIMWRCLHGGPYNAQSLEEWPQDGRMPWPSLRARNLPLLEKLTAAYGSCALLARDGEQVVGILRFYPKAIATRPEAGLLCLQQEYPAGPSAQLLQQPFPPLVELADKTLMVHCLAVGNPGQESGGYQRRGIGTRLAQGLGRWACARGWQAIEATAYEDLPVLYRFTGQAGRTFWQRLGYAQVACDVEPALLQWSDFTKVMREEAVVARLQPESIANKYTMRLELARHEDYGVVVEGSADDHQDCQFAARHSAGHLSVACDGLG